ncbi:MAG: RNA polymerase ECF-type sigma factor, RNA polymerase sigma-70 factor, ECF subfamily [Candidatus Magasanikbacteria bacterium]|nr:RNA polymerase ECF-type sigma factor, RNA polymerase sigma-70 factor, ECF subfamily [Candidatus Magasanikbacteria bacterium]
MTDFFTDKLLLYKVQRQRDAEAYGEFYDRYVSRIYRFIYFKVSSAPEAEDLTSEVFLKTWQYLQDHTDVRNLVALTYRVARNVVIDFYRQRKDNASFEEVIETEDVSDLGALVKNLEQKQDSQKVLAAVRRLKSEYRDIILFRYVDGLSMDEISAILEKSKVGSRVLLHRAMKTLRQLIANNGIAESSANEKVK